MYRINLILKARQLAKSPHPTPPTPFVTLSSRHFLRDPVTFADDISSLMRARGLAKPLFNAVGKSITIESTHPSRIRSTQGLSYCYFEDLSEPAASARNVSFLWSQVICFSKDGTCFPKGTIADIFFNKNVPTARKLTLRQDCTATFMRKDLRIEILFDDLCNCIFSATFHEQSTSNISSTWLPRPKDTLIRPNRVTIYRNGRAKKQRAKA